MMRSRVSIAYDNFSRNTGDMAVGLSLKKILTDLHIDHNELFFNRHDHRAETIMIGGGLLLREHPEPVYDRFKIRGPHILNAMGILDFPKDLQYLDEYKYVTVRNSFDKEKLSYLQNPVHVVPDTTMILEDIPDFDLTLDKKCIGIHLLPIPLTPPEKQALISWANKCIDDGFAIYFLPVTLYANDYTPMYELSLHIPQSAVLPVMNPLQIFTTIGKMDYFISSSLHGGIFALKHNIPFLLFDIETLTKDKKMKTFMKDRGLEKYLFSSVKEMISTFEDLRKWNVGVHGLS